MKPFVRFDIVRVRYLHTRRASADHVKMRSTRFFTVLGDLYLAHGLHGWEAEAGTRASNDLKAFTLLPPTVQLPHPWSLASLALLPGHKGTGTSLWSSASVE